MIRHYKFLDGAPRLGVRFRHERFDLLRLILHFYVPGQKALRASFPISSVYCPFRDMISWLEALVAGAQDCTWHWESEGPEASIRFDRTDVTVHSSEDGVRGHHWSSHLEFHISRRALVHAFYTGFRAFAGSTEYQPERYCGDCNPLTSHHPGFNREAFVAFLLPLDAATASTVLGALCKEATYDPHDDADERLLNPMPTVHDDPYQGYLETTPQHYRLILGYWDRIGRAARHRVLMNLITRGPGVSPWGADLFALRSERVERYLSQPVASLEWRLL